MSQETSAPIGLSIPSRQPQHQALHTIEDVESVASLTPTHTRNDSPLSPFYDHSPGALSHQATKSDSKQNLDVYESDVEACLKETNNSFLTLKKTSNTNCTVWPGQKALKEAKLAEKKKRKGCFNPMRGLDARTRFWIKILIGCIIAGVAIGVGLGITKAVHGGVWHQDS